MTAIRMACRASWNIWCILYAARDHERSWLKSLHGDIRWLASSSSLFKDLDHTSLAPWLQMARDSPVSTAKAIRKACDQADVRQMAVVLQSNDAAYIEPVRPSSVVDLPSAWTFVECDYSCGTKTALKCHMTTAHGQYSEVGKCIDTCWCTVCGLLFDDEALVAEHVGKSKVCRLNLLLRGPHLDEAAHAATLARRSEFRRRNKRGGLSQGKVTNLCVRTFGPHQLIVDANGERLLTSKRGHPLGDNKPLYLPSGLLRPDLDAVVGCEATRYRPCSAACLMCKGLEDSG